MQSWQNLAKRIWAPLNQILDLPLNDLELIVTFALEMTLTLVAILRPNNLDLHPLTLILKLDLDMVMMYNHAKKKIDMSMHSKVIACTDRQTSRQTDTKRQKDIHTDKKHYLTAYAGGNKNSCSCCNLHRNNSYIAEHSRVSHT